MSTNVFERILVRSWHAVVLVLGAGLIGPTSAASQSPLAIIVSAENPMEDISLRDLQKLFEGRSTRLGDISSVVLYQHAPSREQFYEQALNTTVSRATRAWMALVFSGGGAAPPVDFDRAIEVVQAVATIRGGLGFVPLSEVDTDLVRVLTVDGWSTADPRYPLR
jgi:hypothetical protein